MNLKPKFEERMKLLLGVDYKNYLATLEKDYINSLRCNTLKITPEKLKEKLSKKWKISQPFKEFKEIFFIDEKLQPGEIGRALEHQLGYYYVQETSSMMPALALNPQPNEIILDLAASPGSKTTQIASMMENSGTLIANDVSLGRVKILSANLQRCAVTNIIATHHEGSNLCNRLNKTGFEFDKILVDAPCSGEGTLRTSPKTCLMFNENIIKKLSKIQKSLIISALKVLKVGGEIVYSTCTHAPEENEGVINEILKQENIEILEIKLPLKTRQGITSWQDKKYSPEVKKCVRIYPQDNNTEGFFIAKMRRVK